MKNSVERELEYLKSRKSDLHVKIIDEKSKIESIERVYNDSKAFVSLILSIMIIIIFLSVFFIPLYFVALEIVISSVIFYKYFFVSSEECRLEECRLKEAKKPLKNLLKEMDTIKNQISYKEREIESIKKQQRKTARENAKKAKVEQEEIALMHKKFLKLKKSYENLKKKDLTLHSLEVENEKMSQLLAEVKNIYSGLMEAEEINILEVEKIFISVEEEIRNSKKISDK